jgi:serine/threonine protein kinase
MHCMQGNGWQREKRVVAEQDEEIFRPVKAFRGHTKWSVESLKHDQVYSLLDPPEDAGMSPEGETNSGSHLPDIDVERFNSTDGVGMPSWYIAVQSDASAPFRRNHTKLRQLLLKGHRLREEMFHIVQPPLNQPPPPAPFPPGGSATFVVQPGDEQGGPIAARQIEIKPELHPMYCRPGASGVICLARLKDDETIECVIKTFLLQLNDSKLDDFEEQFTCLYMHHHPNIVPIYDMSFHSIRAQGVWKLALFMHYADQGSLDQMIQVHKAQERTIPTLMLLGVTAQMLEALRFLHTSVRVCHRDLKPSNVLLRSDGRVMLQDFGNGRRFETMHKDMETFVGCVQYMSPERICGAKYTYKADIWSLGLIVLECLLGEFPYDMQGVMGPFDVCDTIVAEPVPLHLIDGSRPTSGIEECATRKRQKPDTYP